MVIHLLAMGRICDRGITVTRGQSFLDEPYQVMNPVEYENSCTNRKVASAPTKHNINQNTSQCTAVEIWTDFSVGRIGRHGKMVVVITECLRRTV